MRALHRLWQLQPLQRMALLRRRFTFLAYLNNRKNLLLYRQYTLGNSMEMTQEKNNIYISCLPHPTTGFGHRFSEWNTGLIVARRLGLEYLHAGIGAPWGAELGLDSAYSRADIFIEKHGPAMIQLPYVEWHERADGLDEICSMIGRICPRRKPVIVFLADGQNLFRQHDSTSELQQIYRQNKPQGPSAGNSLRIAMHIRRGDVTKMKQARISNWQERYVDLAWFQRVYENVLVGLGGQESRLEVFSQGSTHELSPLAKMGRVAFFVDTDPVLAFHQMVSADLLITSPSSFSFNAGLLSSGLKIAQSPWWHQIPEQADWIRVSSEIEQREEIAERVKHWQQNGNGLKKA